MGVADGEHKSDNPDQGGQGETCAQFKQNHSDKFSQKCNKIARFIQFSSVATCALYGIVSLTNKYKSVRGGKGQTAHY